MDPLEFRLTSAHVAERTFVVTLGGEVDVANAGAVDTELELLHGSGAEHLIVDLLDVPFLDSTALGVLLRHSRRLQTEGRELLLVTDDVRITRTVEIAGLRSFFHIVPSLRQAIDQALSRAVYT